MNGPHRSCRRVPHRPRRRDRRRRWPRGYGLTVWATTCSSRRATATRPRRRRHAEASARPRRPHAGRRRARWWQRRPQHGRADRPTRRTARCGRRSAIAERDRARRRRRTRTRTWPSWPSATRPGRSRSSRASATRTRTSRTSRRSRTGGRARRARAAAPGGSAATSTAPWGSTTRSPAIGIGPVPSPALLGNQLVRDVDRRRHRSPTRGAGVGRLRRRPRRRRGRKFAPASPDPATLLGEVQEAIRLTVKARDELDADLATARRRRPAERRPRTRPPSGQAAERGRRLAAARGATRRRRSTPPRVIYVNGLGDYDTHQGQAQRHPALMADLDAGIDAFFTTLDAAAGEPTARS